MVSLGVHALRFLRHKFSYLQTNDAICGEVSDGAVRLAVSKGEFCVIQERRTAQRVNFGAVAEVFALGTRRQLVALIRDLSLGGCFVRTQDAFPQGTEVQVRITSSGETFSAIGRVTGNINAQGMGIQFVEIDSHNQAVIENWLDLTK